MNQEKNEKTSWTQTSNASGEELFEIVKGLINEVGVRRIVVRKKEGDVLFDIPLFLGIASLVLLRFWAVLPIAAGLIADYTIEVTREGRAETEGVERKEELVEIEIEPPVAAPDSSESAPEPPTVPDTLTKINGIGPKVAGLLNESGITTFAQLAAASVADLQAVLDKAGSRYRIIDPATWPEQAKQLMN